MKILIADDHTVVRAGLKQILLADFPGANLDEASCFQDVADKVDQEPTSWDLIILDMSMPGGNGLDLLRHIKQKNEKIPVLVLSMYSEEQFGMRAIKSGASGYLNKESAPREVVNAVRTALTGRRYMSEALAKRLADPDEDPETICDWHTLSEREIGVMRLLYEGVALKEIAARMEISVKTVSTYRKRILKKLHIGTNAELVQVVIKNKLFGSEISVTKE